MSSRSPVSLPDVLVGLGCVALAAGLLLYALSRRGDEPRPNAGAAWQLRNIHQAMLLYGVDNGGYLPGLGADGSFLTNDPAARFGLLTEAKYLRATDLQSPDDPDPRPAGSYALLDIASPGARREAWTTRPLADAPVLAQRPGLAPEDGAWSGWVQYHGPPQTFPPVWEASSRVDADYSGSGPPTPDDLFTRESGDDAYLIAAE